MKFMVGDLRDAMQGLEDDIPIYLWSNIVDDVNLIVNGAKRGTILDIGETDEETYSGEALFICIEEME